MSELAQVTFEEAKHCPKCDKPGEEVSSYKAPGRKMAHVIHCKNELCTWYSTGWVVQVNPDGTIPVRESGPRGHDKDFEKLSPEQQAAAKRFWEDQDAFEKGQRG